MVAEDPLVPVVSEAPLPEVEVEVEVEPLPEVLLWGVGSGGAQHAEVSVAATAIAANRMVNLGSPHLGRLPGPRREAT